MTSDCFIGVDVGTASVRAALLRSDGQVISKSSWPIRIHNPRPDFYEQSSEDIWNAVCRSVADLKPSSDSVTIRAIGFAATCSLVIQKISYPDMQPVTPTSPWDVIMWMDHRAGKETELINRTAHPVLKNVGGRISVEMEVPKLLWIKNNLPEVFNDEKVYFFDLADFLTWKSTGSRCGIRSLCTTICKWNLQTDGHTDQPGYDDTFFRAVGLTELLSSKRIGTTFLSPGTSWGVLSAESSEKMGLSMYPDVRVSVSMIDAHSGVLGLLSLRPLRDLGCGYQKQMSMICGTSSCLMALSGQPLFVPGVWGPYRSVILPGFYLNEGGQSAVGSLLDHVIRSHPAFKEAQQKAENQKLLVNQILERQLLESTDPHRRTRSLHVLPDFHGNRSPLSDPDIRGMISGLSLDESLDSLALLYLATVQALAYGCRQVLQQLKLFGHDIEALSMCGGLAQSDLFVQTHADVLGIPIVVPEEPDEPVLRGAAVLAAVSFAESCSELANNKLEEVFETILQKMQYPGHTFQPTESRKQFHDQKFRVFMQMYQDQKRYADLMKSDQDT